MGVATKLPTLFITHGGGPMPLLGDPSHKALVKHLTTLAKQIPKPTAILMVSGALGGDSLLALAQGLLKLLANAEEALALERHPTVTSGEAPQVIYDYGGFPPESYTIKYGAKGSPSLAKEVATLLRSAGFQAKEDAQQGWDHGTFVPLKLLYPDADVPVVQLSLLSSLDAREHLKLGEALAPLREQGVLLVGSGSSFHNMGAFMVKGRPGEPSALNKSKEFDEYLRTVCTSPKYTAEQRQQLLADWAKAPQARYAHPREEHLLPLHVIVGAAGADAGTTIFNDNLFSVIVSSFQFG